MMNHPFPANLPLLRRIYRDRFSEVRFLIPFERMPDEDVITVYRGSYTHAAYLTDAHAKLAALDCDYYVVIHDDVLLNPKISEASFQDIFDLGPDDGFIPSVSPLTREMGEWTWNFAFLPRLLFSKSLLFGSGIEISNLLKYLPSADALNAGFERNGVTPTQIQSFHPGHVGEISGLASSVLLSGLVAPPKVSERFKDAVEVESLEIERGLIEVLRKATRKTDDEDRSDYRLPIPVVASGYFTDFYILPRSGLDDFSHYMGVAGAANLFVEIIAPTLLHACCARVRTGRDLNLDFNGFHNRRGFEWFADPRAVAMHPFKMSAIKTDEARDAFIAILDATAEDRDLPEGAYDLLNMGPPVMSNLGTGWHMSEPWGAWASRPEATILIDLSAPRSIRFRLRAATHPTRPSLSGRLTCDDEHGGVEVVPFTVTWPSQEVDVVLPRLVPDAGRIGHVTLVSDIVDLTTLGGGDDRKLGFGLMEVELIA